MITQLLNFRQKGKSYSSGQISKGIINNPLQKHHTASIPSQHSTAKAFGCSQTRFIKKQNFQQPGPGSYFQHRNKQTQKPKNMPAFSSSSKRKVFSNKYVNMGPAPNNYQVTSLKTKSRSTSFTKENRINKNSLQKILYDIPGPGSYQTHVKQKLKAFSIRPKDTNQPTSFTKNLSYDYDLSKIQTFRRIKGPNACFVKRNSEKKLQKQLKLLQSLALQQKQREQGPGSYESSFLNSKSSKKMQFRKGQINRLIIQKSTQKTKHLGPGCYESKQFQFNSKKKILLGMLSKTQRKLFQDSQKRLGPNCGDATTSFSKKNFNLNSNKKWV